VASATQAHSSVYGENDYGYAWWVRDRKVGYRTYRTFQAAGNGGQLVIGVPELDLVVTFMGGNYNNGPVWWRWADELLPKYILAAARPG
jgi:hypothetical protein